MKLEPLKSLASFIEIIANLPMTFWGILVLFISIHVAIHNSKEIGYYFAGVGSTLLGINQLQGRATTIIPPANMHTNIESETKVSNASNNAS